VVTQEAVVVLDVGRDGTPEEPTPYAYEETEQFAMTIDADDGLWTVGDWNILSLWETDDGTSPAIDLGLGTVAFLDGADTRFVDIINRGNGTLELSGISVPDGVTAEVSAESLEPGEVASMALTWDGSTLTNVALVCIATNDPSRPDIQLLVSAGSDGEGEAIGQSAPDFSLTGLDGNTYRLSEQLGHPVVLAYFATW
jgi:hypothetical protein